MIEREATIGPAEGLHARPAAVFVKEAKRYASEVKIVKDGREVNAKSSLQILTVGAKKGESITIRAEGEDAEQAVEALADLISREEPPDESYREGLSRARLERPGSWIVRPPRARRCRSVWPEPAARWPSATRRPALLAPMS